MKLSSGTSIVIIAALVGGGAAWWTFHGVLARPEPTPVPTLVPTDEPLPHQTAMSLPAPTAAPSSPVPSLSAIPDVSLLAAMNAERFSRGLPLLVQDTALDVIALAHSHDMVAREYFSHTSPDGTTFQERVTASGYAHAGIAENIGVATTVQSIIPSWMSSPGHKANILNADYTRVGTGIAQGIYQGQSVVFVTAVFAVPR